MNITVTATIENACEGEDVPDPSTMRRWLSAALTYHAQRAATDGVKLSDPEISIRIVDEAESQALNARYRQHDTPTNVLSFPADIPDYVELPLLGDIVICAPVVIREAREQHKTPDAHWAHMVVHGTLHLLGYDHLDDADAAVMENLETDILKHLNYPPPYIAVNVAVNATESATADAPTTTHEHSQVSK